MNRQNGRLSDILTQPLDLRPTMSSRDFRLLSHEAMEFIRIKIAVNLVKTCICDHNDIDQNDDSVNLVNQMSDMSDDESDEELENSGGDDEAREEASSMIV